MANNEFWSTVFLHSWLPVSHTPNQGMQLKEVLDQNLDVSFQDLFGHEFFSILRFKLPVILFFCPHDMSQVGIKLSRPREPEMVGTDAIGFFRFHDFMNSWVNLCPTDWVNPSGPSLLARLSGWPWWTMVNHYEPRNTTNWLLNFVIKSHTSRKARKSWRFFPTCQVRVVRFYQSCSPPPSPPPPPRSPPPPLPPLPCPLPPCQLFAKLFANFRTQWPLLDLNCKGLSALGTAGPQPGTFRAQWAPLDLNGQIQCQKICQILECQKICQNICQKLCQNIARSYAR